MRRGGVLAAVVAASLSVGVVSSVEASAANAAPNKPVAGAARVSTLAQERSAAKRAMHVITAAARRAPRSAAPRAVTNPFSGLVSPLAALPTSARVFDPVGDNIPTLDARGDLIETAVATNATALAVGSVTEAFDDPSASANWMSSDTIMEWGLDVNADGTPDYIVQMFNDSVDGLGVIAGVVDRNFAFLCLASPSWNATNKQYFVAFTRSCVHSPARVQAQGFFQYENEAAVDSDDVTDWTGAIAPTAPTPPPVVHKNGYWMLGADGHVYAFGGAQGFSGFVAGAVAMAPRSDGTGYWVVDRAGHVFSYGTAHFFGGTPALGAGEFVSTISATQNDAGYWLFTNRGRAFSYGNAGRFGDMSGTALNGPIVASVATPTGRGYYMVGSDGGIFSFGDARFHGSTGNIHLNKPVVGISPTPDSRGYWLVASDGGVFAFAAPFRGSMGATTLNRPVDGLVAFGNGYLMAASDGGIFDFSNKPFEGSLAEHPPTAPIIGVAAFST
jgi:hypothetical protein